MASANLFTFSKRFVRKPSKRLYTSKTTKTTFPKNGLFLIWHGMRCQTHDVKKTKVPNVASDNQPSPNLTLHLNKKHVLFHVETFQQILKTVFLVTTKESSQAELKKTFLERTQRRFGKFLFCSRNKSCFYKSSITQDISNAGCKEPNYQT